MTELRLPAIGRMWPRLTERSDREGWPAVRLLAALAELEVAERGRRRIERHVVEARLPPGKTLDRGRYSLYTIESLDKPDTASCRSPALGTHSQPATAPSIVAPAPGRDPAPNHQLCPADLDPPSDRSAVVSAKNAG